MANIEEYDAELTAETADSDEVSSCYYKSVGDSRRSVGSTSTKLSLRSSQSQSQQLRFNGKRASNGKKTLEEAIGELQDEASAAAGIDDPSCYTTSSKRSVASRTTASSFCDDDSSDGSIRSQSTTNTNTSYRSWRSIRSSKSSQSSLLLSSEKAKQEILPKIKEFEQGQTLGGPKYYIVAQNVTGRTTICHEAMPLSWPTNLSRSGDGGGDIIDEVVVGSGDDANNVVPEERGYEVFEYDLLTTTDQKQPQEKEEELGWVWKMIQSFGGTNDANNDDGNTSCCNDDDDETRTYYSIYSYADDSTMASTIGDDFTIGDYSTSCNIQSKWGLHDSMHHVLLNVGGYVHSYVGGEPEDATKRRLWRKAMVEGEEVAKVWRDLSNGKF